MSSQVSDKTISGSQSSSGKVHKIDRIYELTLKAYNGTDLSLEERQEINELSNKLNAEGFDDELIERELDFRLSTARISKAVHSLTKRSA